MPQLITPQRLPHQAVVVTPLTILTPVVIGAAGELPASERPVAGDADRERVGGRRAAELKTNLCPSAKRVFRVLSVA